LTYSIRPMEKDDLPQVNEIDREAFPTQWPPPNYHHELQNRVARYIVLCDDARQAPVAPGAPPRGRLARLLRRLPWRQASASASAAPRAARPFIIGFSGIWIMAGEAHITNIAVRRQYQGRGLGEMLLIATIDLAASLNASFLTLEVRVSNLVARKLYEKYAFTETGQRRGYYLDNHEDAVIMSTEPLASTGFQENLRKLKEALVGKLQ
jgi:ribosomal-protein-alanine N-acetyltransferase